MEKLGGLCVLLAALSRAVAGDKVTAAYFTDGGALTFNVTPSYPDPITNILWKFKGNLLAEWVLGKIELEFYSTFKERADLDTTNARLVVRKMSRADTGAYTVEINSKVHGESYDARWIRKLVEPEVFKRPLTCGPGTERCNVNCVEDINKGAIKEADITETGPVTYSWKIGEKGWKVSEKDIEINKTDHVYDKTITCRISNPVSERVSKTIDNPLYYYDIGPAVGGTVGVVLVSCLVALLVMFIKKIGPFKYRNSTDPGPTNPPTQGGPPGKPTKDELELLGEKAAAVEG